MSQTQSQLPELPCMCANFRRASRAMTQMYEESLRPLGLRGTQFTILQALVRTGEVAQGRLGEILAMDSTSLTRTLAIMERKGWVDERKGEDRRERWISLSREGEAMLGRATPVWEKVQLELRRKLGTQTWESLLQLTYQVTKQIKAEGDSL